IFLMIPRKKSIILFILACLFLSGISFVQAQPAEIYNNGGFNSSIKMYRNSAERNEISGYLNLAAIFKDMARYELGIKVLNAARIKFKDDFRLLGYLGRMYYLNGQLEQSISVLERLSQITANDREALITLGLCYQEKGNDAAALEYFHKALDVDSNNVIARLSLADIYYRQNRLEESAQEYKALSFIDASIEQIYEYWADILFKVGSYKEALKLYEKITFMEPQNKNAQKRSRQVAYHPGESREYGCRRTGSGQTREARRHGYFIRRQIRK
ncbi:MAG: tetratricopeptide repeat protein, partial [Candidatus Omnitrophica bacterium]|nr:tetratricopeptide repeat protein [Candidatus Omnitrophota bacterium]